jgi:hypothetical protein
MTLGDAYYGGLPAAFEALSRDTYLPRGAGLPGLAWQRDEVVVMSELNASTRFLRGEVASDAGIRRGVALPCPSTTQASYVLALLSGQDTPVAQRVERWVWDGQAATLRRTGGHCEVAGELSYSSAILSSSEMDLQLTHGQTTGTPVILDKSADLKGPMGAAAVTSGAQAVVCLPVLSDDKVSEWLMLYL